uniref:Uncharacterized protein n=2 Tax=viral metagenome TaxID=1070528 RepID=A0A6M3IZ51_9ZZZZ
MANELKIRVVFDTGGSNKPLGDLPPKIKAVEGSLKDLEIQWKKLEAIAKSGFAIGSPGQIQALNNADIALKKYKDALTQTVVATTQSTRPTANATVTLQALNYTIRDSPYFFRDFSLGILAIGNNLNPLIDGLIRMNTEAKLTGKTLGGSLLQSLKGSAGLVFAFSLLVSIMQAVVFAMAKTKGGADKLTDSLEILKGIISELIEFENPFEKWVFPIKTMDIDRMIEATDAEIKKLKEQEQRSAYQFMVPLKYRDQLKPLTEEEKKRQKLNEELLKTLEEQRLKLEAQKLVAERLKELGIEPISKDKKGKELDISKYGLESLDEFLQKRNEILKSYEDEVKAINKTTASQEKKNIALEKNLSDRDIRLKKLDIEREKEIAEARDKWISSESKRLEDIAEKRASTEERWLDELEKKRLDREKKEEKEGLWRAEGQIEKLRELQSVGRDVGETLFQAFMHSKQGVDELIRSLGLAIAKMMLLKLIEFGINSIIGGLLPTPTTGKAPSLLPSIPRPDFSMLGGGDNSTKALVARMDALNMNLMNNQQSIIIQTDIDGLKFTKRIVNPSQAKLIKGNVISVS